ncbi:universal stress protein UspA [Salinivibrio sp. AR647]|uniref:universal stress protein n=1 Tax=Salinivibrio sp. AR647 TaxID=1909438 RepID=UPI00098683DA|nr:universal stress protein [Salinivibrio sp. AR647]OOE91762.1 universal stress protein UspA [Salinivibrio sp. AR647]
MNKIIACIDGASYTQSVTDLSVWAASRLSAPLTFLHVLEKPASSDSELSGSIGLGSRDQLMSELVELDEKRAKLALQHGKALLHECEEVALSKGLTEVTRLQQHGHLLESLLALESTMRVLVIGRSGDLHQNDAKAIGSQLESVVRRIHNHILIATGDVTPPDSYLLAFDGSEVSEKLVEKALNTPLLKGMTCHLVVVDNDAHSEAFERAAQRLTAQGVDVVQARLSGEPAQALLAYQAQQNVGLITMGAYGHTKLRQLFVGSTTTRIVIDSPVPLLLIR